MSRISCIKQGFFNKLPQTKPLTFKDDFNLSQIKAEFSSLYSLFIANQHWLKRDREIVLYLDYLCQFLIDYYTLDYVADELESVQLKRKKIARFLETESTSQQTMLNDEKSILYHGLSPGLTLKKIAIQAGRTIKSSAKIRAYIARMIAARSYWNNSRALANHFIRFAVFAGIAEEFGKLNQALGVQWGVVDFVRLLDESQGILRLSSVALNGLRLAINVSMFIKHLVLAARNEKLSFRKVLLQEIEKRFYNFSDDLTWTVVNLLSNYRQLFTISAATAACLNLVFLGMDAVMLMVSWLVERKNYYHHVQELKQQKEGEITDLQAAFIDRQLEILADEWEVTCAYFSFNIAAAVLLFAVFSITLIFPNPLLFAFLALLSMIGNAMYNSAKEFKQYREVATAVKRERLNQQSGREDTEQGNLLLIKKDQAFSHFFNTFLFNIGFTASLIAVAAVSLPLAGIMVLLYIGYKVQQSFDEKEMKESFTEENEFVYRIPALETRAVSLVSL